jgi:hypothetical protein
VSPASWKKAAPWLVIAALAGALFVVGTGSDQTDQSTNSDQTAGTDQQEPTKPRTVAQLLDDCSPFQSFDGLRTLEFDAVAHTVELREAVGDERNALLAEHPQTTQGTWTADEATRTVVVNLASIPTTYILVVPPSQAQCILAHGPVGSADLQASWFGTLTDTSGNSND